MFSKITSLVLVTAIFSSATVVSAISPRTGNEKDAEKVKTEIRQLGTGPDAQIKLKLRDKTKLEGYVSEANENDFTVVNPKTGTATTVAYPQVGQARGNNLSGGVKIAITIAVIAAVTYLTYKYGRRNRRFGF
ncbi:MAG: hypothetical protein WAU71_10285 [Pyrinomonadaceae bacterium]